MRYESSVPMFCLEDIEIQFGLSHVTQNHSHSTQISVILGSSTSNHTSGCKVFLFIFVCGNLSEKDNNLYPWLQDG